MNPKESIILLHGAIGAGSQLTAIKEKLQTDFTVHSFNFEGHGGRPSENDYSIELFVQNTLDFMNENDIQSSAFFGYSMGGYVALKLAANHPEKVISITTYGTKFNWTPESAEREMKMMNPEKIEEKVPKFASMLNDLHAPLDWKMVMSKTAEMMFRLGNQPSLSSEDLVALNIPVSLCVGEQDQMVTQEETKKIADQISGAEYYLLENSAHPIETANLDKLLFVIHSQTAKIQETRT